MSAGTSTNHLHAFFRRYYQDGDFVPKRRYSWEHPYVVPYNGEEVHFHWANRDQYYVKAAEHFTDYRYRTRSGVSVRFSVRSANVEQNDTKGKTRFYFPLVGEAAWDAERRALEVPFDHRLPTAAEAKELKKNGQQEAILERAEASVREALAATPEAAKALLDPRGDESGDDDSPTLFTHHARRFARKRTSDFFIHRDLRAFLARELDYYLRSEVLALRSLVAGGEERADAWIEKVRIIREVGTNVIDFLAQIEGFQKMLWEKRKFRGGRPVLRGCGGRARRDPPPRPGVRGAMGRVGAPWGVSRMRTPCSKATTGPTRGANSWSAIRGSCSTPGTSTRASSKSCSRASRTSATGRTDWRSGARTGRR